MADFEDEEPVIEELDRQAARRAMARHWPTLEQSSPKYTAMLESLAGVHSIAGADDFELRYGLRPPKDRAKEWTLQFMREEISSEELGARLKADAERPIDLEMLTTFCDSYQDNLEHYSGILQNAVISPREAADDQLWRAREKIIEEHIEALAAKLPLWKKNLKTVFEYLDELRITSGAGLVKVGEFEGTSAHWLAQLVFTRTQQAWKSCKGVSERSHSDPRYLYAARSTDLFL
jgi:hypothetical protein